MKIVVRNLSQTRAGRFKYRRAVPDDCRTIVGKREWLVTFGRLSPDAAASKAMALNAEYDEVIRTIRAHDGAIPVSEEQQAAMTVLGLDDVSQLDTLTTVAELLRDLVAGNTSAGVTAKLAKIKGTASASARTETISSVYAEDMQLFGGQRRDEKVVRISVDSLIDAVGDISFGSLTHRHALQYREYLQSRGNQAATINRRLGPLKAIWNRWSQRCGVEAGRNPFAGAGLKVESARDKKLPFHASHLDIIASASFTDVTGAQIALMRATGIGPSELAGLMPADVIFDHAIPHIWVRENARRKLKTGEMRERRIPVAGLSEDVVRKALLERYTSNSDNALSAKLNKALRSAGLPESPRLTCYSFRHTLKAALREAEVSPFIADRIMGHAGEKGAGGLYGSSKGRLASKLDAIKKAHAVLGHVESAIYRDDELSFRVRPNRAAVSGPAQVTAG